MKIKQIFSFFLFFLISTEIVFAADKIVFLDLNFILSNSDRGKKLLNELKVSGININETELKILLNRIKVKLSKQTNEKTELKNKELDLEPAYSSAKDDYKKIVFFEKKDLLDKNIIKKAL